MWGTPQRNGQQTLTRTTAEVRGAETDPRGAGDTEPQYEVADMTNKFLPLVIALVLALGCASAQAIPAKGPSLANYPVAEGFAHQGSYLVDFVQGREVTAEPRGGATPATTSTTEDRAARYASQSAVLTIVFLAVVAMALAGFLAIGKVRQKPRPPEPASNDAWKTALLEMLEADLTNLDSMTHGFSGR
jgi:hypothetical protein